MRTGCVYSLIDPRTGQVRYIGQTIVTPRKRLASHKYQWKRTKGNLNKVNSWIKNLAKEDLFPIMSILEDNIPEDTLDTKEIAYIRMYRDLGATLCNHTDGGGGIRGFKMSEESKTKRLKTYTESVAWKEKAIRQSQIMKERHKEGTTKFGYGHLPKEKREEIGRRHSERMKEYHANKNKYDKGK